MTAWKVIRQPLVIGASLLLLLLPTGLVYAQGSDEMEKCAVKLQDGSWLELDKPKDVELSDGTIIKGHTCEQLQQDYANTTQADIDRLNERVNEAREETGRMFAPEPSLSESIQELTEKIEELED